MYCNGSCISSIMAGSLFYLRYSCEHGTKATSTDLYIAVRYNQLECVKYLVSTGCYRSDETLKLSKLNDDCNCYTYLMSHT